MCDTFVALPPVTAGKSVILGKSADCRVNEAHALVRLPLLASIRETLHLKVEPDEPSRRTSVP